MTTNADFALSDPDFQAACKCVGLEPTRRQASKYRRETGLAYEAERKILKAGLDVWDVCAMSDEARTELFVMIGLEV